VIAGAHAAASGDLLLVEELLSREERDVRDRVRAFCDHQVRPLINDFWERAEFPHVLLPGLSELGVMGGSIAGHGCPGLSDTANGLVAMELARCDGSVSTFHGVHSGLAMHSIALCGSPEQRDRWLPDMARLARVGAFALTEPDHGSDVVSLGTEARRDGDGYVLNGRKRWIGNATFADLIVVWARDETGKVGAFVVEKGAAGLHAEPITGKVAKRAAIQADVTLDGVRVPADCRLERARSFEDAARVLTHCRPAVAWAALGHALAAYETAFAYTSERVQFGRPLAGHQLVQYRLAKMLAEITTMQLLCLRLGELAAQGRITAAMASLAKMNNAAKAKFVVSEARDLLGGNGLLLDFHVARHLCDVEVVSTVEGTDTMQALIVGREITGITAFG
jgi:glutaryl-CoA dehydrogenase